MPMSDRNERPEIEEHLHDRILRFVLFGLNVVAVAAFTFTIAVYLREARWFDLAALPLFAFFGLLCALCSETVSEVVTEWVPYDIPSGNVILFRDLDFVKVFGTLGTIVCAVKAWRA